MLLNFQSCQNFKKSQPTIPEDPAVETWLYKILSPNITWSPAFIVKWKPNNGEISLKKLSTILSFTWNSLNSSSKIYQNLQMPGLFYKPLIKIKDLPEQSD